jgi:hypothetical protein
MNTGMDDQLARCRVAEEEGWGLVVEKRESRTIVKAIQAIQITDLEKSSAHKKTPHLSWVSDYLNDGVFDN